MCYFFESVIYAYRRFLRIEVSINVSNEKGAFADCRPANDDGFVVFESTFFVLAHYYIYWIQNYGKFAVVVYYFVDGEQLACLLKVVDNKQISINAEIDNK